MSMLELGSLKMSISNTSHYHALIMAGGKGERFWPWSRQKLPKQLLPLFGKKTLIEMTVERLLPIIPKERIWIITNAEQAHAMARQMPRFLKSNFIIEPVGRDSAGAVMLGCATIAKKDSQAIMALLPADQFVNNAQSYAQVLRACFDIAAAKNVLATIGVKPTEPSPAYGYIEQGAKVENTSSKGIKTFQAQRFLEKPDIQTAQHLVRSKRFYWNSGIFVWRASSIYEALKKYSPIHANGWQSLQKNRRSYLAKGFWALPKISIDYAVMEKAKNVCVVEGIFDWDDMGSWTALYKHMAKDKKRNVHQGNVLFLDSEGCLVLGKKKVIAAVGVRDLVIVQTDDATLICHRDASQKIKELVKKLPAKLR